MTLKQVFSLDFGQKNFRSLVDFDFSFQVGHLIFDLAFPLPNANGVGPT